MILDEAEAETELPPALTRYGRTNTIEYHEGMARQFAILSASRGDSFTGVVNVRDICPNGMTVATETLRSWHCALRRGDFDGVVGIVAVKEAVLAAGGTMDVPKRNNTTELNDLPDVLLQYKEMKGDSFDGTVRATDVLPGFGSCDAVYRRLALLISGQYDGQDGVAPVKAALRRMGYLITVEDFLRSMVYF